MSNGFTLPDLQRSLFAQAQAQVPIYNLRGLSPSLQSNKVAQNALISANISAKAQELVELIEAPQQSSITQAAGDVRGFLSQIEDRGLIEILQSHLNVDVNGLAESFRGNSVDVER